MPKIPTLERQSPGARPIYMDVARGGGRSDQAEAAAWGAAGKAVSKIAALFGAEDKEAKNNRINTAAAAGTKMVQDAQRRASLSEKTGSETIKAFDTETNAEAINKVLSGYDFYNDEEKKTAYNKVLGEVEKYRFIVSKFSVEKTIESRSNKLQQQMENSTSGISSQGIYSNTHLQPTYNEKTKKWIIPDISDQINGVIEFAKPTYNKKTKKMEPRTIETWQYEAAKENRAFDIIDFDPVTDKDGKILRYEMSYKGYDLEITEEQQYKLNKAVVYSKLSKLHDYALSYIKSAKSAEELEEFGKAVKITHNREQKEVIIKNRLTGKPQPLDHIQYLEQLLMNNKKHLDVKVGGGKSLYDGLYAKIFTLRDQYSKRLNALHKQKDGDKLKLTNELNMGLFELDRSLDEKYLEISKKIYEQKKAGFETVGDQDVVKGFIEQAKILKLTMRRKILDHYKQHGEVVNYRTALNNYDSFLTSKADALVSLLMREAEGAFLKHRGNASEMMEFKKKFDEYASGLPKSHRKEAMTYLSLLERGNLPAGYRTRANDALEKLFVEGYGRPIDILRKEAGPEVVQYGRMKLKFWEIARDGLKDGDLVIEPNYRGDVGAIAKHVLENWVPKTSRASGAEAASKIRGFTELVGDGGFPGLKDFLSAYDSKDAEEMTAKGRKLQGNLKLFVVLGRTKRLPKTLPLRLKMRLKKMERLKKQMGHDKWSSFIKSMNNLITATSVENRIEKLKKEK